MYINNANSSHAQGDPGSSGFIAGLCLNCITKTLINKNNNEQVRACFVAHNAIFKTN